MWVGAFGWMSRKATTESEAWTMSAGASRAAIRQKRQVLESAATRAIYPLRRAGTPRAGWAGPGSAVARVDARGPPDRVQHRPADEEEHRQVHLEGAPAGRESDVPGEQEIGDHAQDEHPDGQHRAAHPSEAQLPGFRSGQPLD